MTPFHEADARLAAMHGYEPVRTIWHISEVRAPLRSLTAELQDAVDRAGAGDLIVLSMGAALDAGLLLPTTLETIS